MPNDWSYVTFRAGNQIAFKPGFTATADSRFHAYIYNQPECVEQLVQVPEQSTPLDDDFYLNKVKLVSISQSAFIPTINKELNNVTLKVWPNPAQSIFTIMVSNVAANQQLIINLVSMKGEIIPLHLNASLTDKTNRFITINPIEYGLIAGIYTVQVQYNGKNYTSKIFIQP